MSSGDEAGRIARVYREYAASRHAQLRWDWSNRGNQVMFSRRQTAIKHLLSANGFLPLRGRRVLDIGCGNGAQLARLLELGGLAEDLYGVDLLPERVAAARAAFPQLTFDTGNAEKLQFPDSSFELVMAFTVFSSILDPSMSSNVATEMCRVLRTGGAIIWYDLRYDNPRNPNVRGMSARQIKSMFPTLQIRLRSMTVLPPVARRLGPTTPLLYPLLNAFPVLRSHYIGLFIKPQHLGVTRPAGVT